MSVLHGRRAVLISTALCSLLVLLAPPVRIVQDIAGLWLIIGAPACVYFGTARRVVSTADGAGLLALGFAILHDLLALLALDLLLPLVGDRRPLEPLPITLTLAAATILVGAFAPEAEPMALERYWWHRRGFGPVLTLGVVILVLSVAGPVRLNNGLGSGVSMTAMAVIVATLLLLLYKRHYAIAAIELGIYLAAAGILLLTSLRGWLITGHDVQTEYAYFSDVLASGHWEPGGVRNAYYACLSVTLLPVAFAHLTAICGVNVFKVVEPLLFAVTPVLLFRAVRNVASHRVAVLGAIFFIIFPTFSTDLPYMSRQEIAFILVGCAVLLVTDQRGPLPGRRIAFGALLVGAAVSHYSTAYIAVIVCAGAVAVDAALRLWSTLRSGFARAPGKTPERRSAGQRGSGQRRAARASERRSGLFAPWWLVGFAGAAAFIWAGPVTHTDGQVQSTLSAAISQLDGRASSGLFAAKQSDAQLLAGYRQSAVGVTAQDRAASVYWPLSLVDRYQTPTVGTKYQALTSVGQRIQSAGIDVTTANVVARSVDDRAYELFIIVGLVGVSFTRRRLFTPTKDQVLLAVGAMGMLGALTVVPQLSVDYGVLRAFAEGMFFVAPFMAAGLIWICGLLRRWSKPATGALVAVIASTMTGVIPQLTGGYYGILSMANEGQYYDIHYPTRAQLAGAQWLNALVTSAGQRSGSVPMVQADYFAADNLRTAFTGPVLPDILPQWLRPGSYVFVAPTMIRSDQVSNRINGRIVTYRYPDQLLDTQYNKIYASDGAQIYGPEMNN